MGFKVTETRLGGFRMNVRKASRPERLAVMGRDAPAIEPIAEPQPSRHKHYHTTVTVNGLGDPVILVDGAD